MNQTEDYNKHKFHSTIHEEQYKIWSWRTMNGFAFKYVGSNPITETKAQEIQEEDFHLPPSIHGFKYFNCRIVDGLFFVTWICYERLQ